MGKDPRVDYYKKEIKEDERLLKLLNDLDIIVCTASKNIREHKESMERWLFANEKIAGKNLADITIQDLGFSTRTTNALKHAKISTLEELINTYSDEWDMYRKVKYLGRKSKEEVKSKLDSLGINFKGKENE